MEHGYYFEPADGEIAFNGGFFPFDLSRRKVTLLLVRRPKPHSSTMDIHAFCETRCYVPGIYCVLRVCQRQVATLRDGSAHHANNSIVASCAYYLARVLGWCSKRGVIVVPEMHRTPAARLMNPSIHPSIPENPNDFSSSSRRSFSTSV